MIQNKIYQVAELQLICYNVLLNTWNTEIMGFIEEFKILLLNRANKVIGCYEYLHEAFVEQLQTLKSYLL